MDMLLFVVMGPIFLLMGCCWIAGAIERHKNNKMLKDARKRAKREGELYRQMISDGMSWQKASYEAHRQAFYE